MAEGKNYKKIPRAWKNEAKVMRLRYDFDKDGGAVGAIDLGIFEKKSLILSSRVVVKTAGASGGSATVKAGITADDDAFLAVANGAVAALTADKVLSETAGQNLIAAEGQKVTMTIGTAALTAGVIEVILVVADAP